MRIARRVAAGPEKVPGVVEYSPRGVPLLAVQGRYLPAQFTLPGRGPDVESFRKRPIEPTAVSD